LSSVLFRSASSRAREPRRRQVVERNELSEQTFEGSAKLVFRRAADGGIVELGASLGAEGRNDARECLLLQCVPRIVAASSVRRAKGTAPRRRSAKAVRFGIICAERRGNVPRAAARGLLSRHCDRDVTASAKQEFSTK
jgi:hypothetical protein